MAESGEKKSVQRSPSFPIIDLRTALERARAFHNEEGAGVARREIAVTHWGYTAKSSGGKQTLGALLNFGLLEKAGTGRVKLTECAKKILLDVRPNSEDRQRELRKAALSPPIHEKLWNQYQKTNGGLPSDAQMQYDLNVEEGFNPGSTEKFMGQFKASLEYAGLIGSGSIEGEDGKPETKEDSEQPKDENESEPNDSGTVPEVGDRVQWTSQGIEQFPEPARVRAVQEHEGAHWVFVDGSESGCPASQVRVTAKAPKEPKMPILQTIDPPTLPLPSGQDQADALSLTIPFRGKTLSVQVRSQGEPLRSHHVEKVVAHLNLMKDDLDFTPDS